MISISDLIKLGFEEFDYEYYKVLSHRVTLFYTQHNNKWVIFFVTKDKVGHYIDVNISSIDEIKTLIKTFSNEIK